MKIVAFLQNMWVSPNRVAYVSSFNPVSETRELMIAYALFAGCLTGRRLEQVFGEQLCSDIIWQEANPTIADNPRTYYPPDNKHIAAVLSKHSPDVILCFTRAGEDAIKGLMPYAVMFFPCIHPAARGKDTLDRLRHTARALDTYRNNCKDNHA